MAGSDEDSSTSSDSSSSSDEEKGTPSAVRMPAARVEEASGFADPESPSNAHQSSDESGSSDGVLVDLPGSSPEQESRCLQADADSGVLVNIDGSIQNMDRGEDTPREDMFEDASDQLGSGRSASLEESIAVIEIRESSEGRGHFNYRMDDILAECRKYKEEREVFGREVSGLRHQLQDMIDRQSLLAANNDELIEHLRRLEKEGVDASVLTSPTPLHSMLGDCSKLISHLKGILDEQLDSEGAIRELHAVLYLKDQEIEDLHAKVTESNVSRDVVTSYLGSVQEVWAESVRESYDVVNKRLIDSLASALGEECDPLVDSSVDGFSLVEKNTLLLIEKHTRILSDIRQLGLYLEEIRPNFIASEENQSAIVLSVAHEELYESKSKEAHHMEKISILEEENRKMAEQVDKMKESLEKANAETISTKIELEQAESKLVTAKEKLSIAVTKGKSLVQHRDSLKHTLAEKTSDLEKCFLELQQKSDSLESTESIAEGLKLSLAEKTNELEKCVLELQEKSDALGSIEVSAEDLKHSLAERTSELEKCLLELQEKSDALGSTEASAEDLKHSLDERTRELEKCLLELQLKSDALRGTEASAEEQKHSLSEMTRELEKCLLELQEKSDAMRSTEASAEDLKYSLAERTGELLELQAKSDALRSTEASAEDLKQSLVKRTSELEDCLLELQKKSNALGSAEATVEDVKHSLAEKTSELEKCLLEFQQISDDLETSKSSGEKLYEVQNMVHSLQDLLSNRDNILHEIEQVVSQNDVPQELLSMEVVDRVRWFVNQKHISDDIFLENSKIRSVLSFLDLPDIILSTDLESQINWLGKSFTEAKDDIIHLQDEISRVRTDEASHESELSEVRKEIDSLAASLLQEKHKKDSVKDELEDLRCKYEDLIENLSKISSENAKLMKVLLEVSESALDDQTLLNTDTLIEKFKSESREKTKMYHTVGENFDRMQSLLYVKDQDLMLSEKILEEAMIDRSEMTSLSIDCRRASEEIITLRNEKDSIQKELERVEERSYQLRERLSMAVKKGKGLVQEREGFKLSLDEKNSEIERLKQELQLQDSVMVEYREQIKSLSEFPEHIKKLESDIASLKDQRDKVEVLLLQSGNTLKRLLDSIESAPPTDKNFEGPEEKVNWIAGKLHESKVAKDHAEKELDKVTEEAALQASRLADAFTTIKSLEDQLSKAEMQISVVVEEQKEMHTNKFSIQQELEKVKVENYMQVTKLADAYTTIKSLEDALSHANTHISILNNEKSEAESKSKQEINALNAKLAGSMEELAKSRRSFENQSDGLISQIGGLQKLIKDESLFSLMTEEFRNKIGDLRNMALLIQNMHDQFATKRLHDHPGAEYPEFAKLHSLQQFEDFIKERMVHSVTVTAELDTTISFPKIVEGFHAEAEDFRSNFKYLSRYMDDHIALLMQALQAAKEEFTHMLQFNESMKLNADKLEAQNMAQEVKISSLQNRVNTLHSACTDATQELQLELHDMLGSGSEAEQDKLRFYLQSRSREDVSSSMEEDSGETAEAAKSLLLTAGRIRFQLQQLVDVKGHLEACNDDLAYKLKQAELAVEIANSNGHLNQEKVSRLEGDLETKEEMLRNKEAELLSLHQSLTVKGRGIGDKLLSQEQMEALIDKVNSMEIPFNDLENPSRAVHFSSYVDKIFYVIDKVTELQHMMESLTYDKKEMQLILASHVREVEYLKKSNETISSDYQGFEAKKTELAELTIELERIIQNLGGNYSLEDQKSTSAKGLLTILERLTTASSTELNHFKSRVQELGAKLQAKEKIEDELSAKVKLLEDSFHARIGEPDIVKERTVFESSTTASGSEISEIEDVGPLGKNLTPPASTAAHVRTMRKGSSDHLILSIDSESDRLISAQEIEDKGHVFKSLNTSGFIPKQGKLMADRIDGIWVSGGRVLMSKPGARLGLIAYWFFLHLWLLGTIL